jgi:tRNA threonylcarbamoyladenosine biosynthesis protein TsaE
MTRLITFLSANEQDTDWLGIAVASQLHSGLTIALNGQLGSGKTRFTRALCGALGVDTSRVTSPTFVLMQLYTDGRLPVAHFDTYRIGDTDEFAAIGAEEYLNSKDWICLVEWAERVAGILPIDRLTIQIQHESPTSRRFDFSASGELSKAVLDGVSAAIALHQ